MEDMVEHLQNTAAEHCVTSELWFQRRGEIAMLKVLLAYEDAEKEQYDMLDLLRFPDEEGDDDDTNPLED